jgi:hypothetical protein
MLLSKDERLLIVGLESGEMRILVRTLADIDYCCG